MKQVKSYATLVAENQGSDILAKMLSESGCTILYKPVKTAYADVLNRVVVMPFWDVSKIVSIALRAHEISHLLHSPYSDFHAVVTLEHPLVKQAGITQRNAIKFYVNVLEDIRIEKLLAVKYPGLAKIFSLAHHEMYLDGFYKTSPTDESLLDPASVRTIMDKVLILGRLGQGIPGLKFTEADMKWYYEAKATQTFDQVVELAVRIYMLEEKSQESSLFEKLLEMFAGISKELAEKIKKDISEYLEKNPSENQDSAGEYEGGDPTNTDYSEDDSGQGSESGQENGAEDDSQKTKSDGDSLSNKGQSGTKDSKDSGAKKKSSSETGKESGSGSSKESTETTSKDKKSKSSGSAKEGKPDNGSGTDSPDPSTTKKPPLAHGSNLDKNYDTARDSKVISDSRAVGSITVKGIGSPSKFFTDGTKGLRDKIFF